MEWERRPGIAGGEWNYGGKLYLFVASGHRITCIFSQVPSDCRTTYRYSVQDYDLVPLIEKAIDDGWLTEYAKQALALDAMGAEGRARAVIGDALRRLFW